jgi:hypothetical protein
LLIAGKLGINGRERTGMEQGSLIKVKNIIQEEKGTNTAREDAPNL